MSDNKQKIREIHADNTIVGIRSVGDCVFVKLEGDIEPVDLEIKFFNCQSFLTSYGWQRELAVDGLWIKDESELLSKTKLAIKEDHPNPDKEIQKYKAFNLLMITETY